MSESDVTAQLEAKGTAEQAAVLASAVNEKLNRFEGIVDALEARLELQYSVADRRIIELIDRVTKAGGAFADAIDAVTEKVSTSRQALESKSAELVSRYENATAMLDSLAEVANVSRDSLEGKLQTLDEDFTALETETRGLADAMRDHADEFRAAVEDAATRTTAQITQLVEAANTLLNEADQQARHADTEMSAFEDGANQLSSSVNLTTSQSATRTDAAFHDGMENSLRLFEEQSAEARSTFGALTAEAGQVMNEYDQRMKRVLGGTSNLLALIRQIRPVIDLIRQIA